ncbi:MucR family transcriptional regulator [Mycobacterium sp. KBS0706]|uniref:MucR family transcriptional regulator n=1 Tax=Mycobacterium sp. KBS0706 TaxID=2578109 RepID=UPI00110F8F21|nr:MucR family transcriptional regulator [Mycobacterium sp. KBS0706]TSD87886.1 MucR family transcriptional regulator [Mycobacterium sp. KBS0706]
MSTLSDEILKFTKEIIVAHVSHNAVDSESLPDLIRNVHLSLIEARDAAIQRDPAAAAEPATNAQESGGTHEDPVAASPDPVPAVPVSESVTPDHIICLEDGRPFKMMKRWLRATYGMTPEQYRARWNLPADYPMVAPNYARSKSVYAKAQGLGTEKLRRVGKQRSRRTA